MCVGVGALLDSLLYLSLSHANDSFSLEAFHVYIIFSLCPSLSERLQCVTTAARLRRLVSMVTQRRAQKWWAGYCKKRWGRSRRSMGHIVATPSSRTLLILNVELFQFHRAFIHLIQDGVDVAHLNHIDSSCLHVFSLLHRH